LQRKSYPEGETLVERLLNPRKEAYKVCYKGNFFLETESDLQILNVSYFTFCEDETPDEVGEEVQRAEK